MPGKSAGLPQVIGRRAEYLPLLPDGQAWGERTPTLGVRDINMPGPQANENDQYAAK